MNPAPGPPWTAGQVARQLGIAESTLRAWHRRYGIGPHPSQPGRYRRYSVTDVARLRHMRDLISQGMLASDAAHAVIAGEAAPATEPAAIPAERDLADLVAAARAADAERCRALLDSVLARRGVVEAWQAVCRPALVIVDADQRDRPDCMDIEHALSWAVGAALHRVPRAPVLPGAGLVLLACVSAEQHTLPLTALAAALGGRGVPVRMLGAATPTAGLVRAVRDTTPPAVALWAQRPDTADLAVLRQLRPHAVRLFAAGPGWATSALEGVEHLADLPQALTALAG